ncbi:coiled-coil domain-containing protein [Legionella spiritensis]|uniref:IncA protein n=1 Tax=Legionella spiritensis TaxID=452 RepID=A0A0W0YWF3_LEGSP|nr:hypothetical protein [Legionella spiritensis]KTD61176.1 IncA protein [Legionella spiritensis]SNV28512.1 Membrane-bound metallopeptidase [Legionella spiritensis]
MSETVAENPLDLFGLKGADYARKILTPEEKSPRSITKLSKYEGTRENTLKKFQADLASLNPQILTLQRQDPKRKKETRDKLVKTWALLYDEYLHKTGSNRPYGLDDLRKQMMLCQAYLDILDGREVASPESAHEAEFHGRENYFKILAMRTGQWLADKMQELSGGKTKVIKGWMGELNGRRLYWVWGGGMLSSILALLPTDFFNNQQAQKALAVPGPAMGYISWLLYYARFGLELGLLLKHTIKGPWMDATEHKFSILSPEDIASDKLPEENHLYFQVIDGKIAYSVLTPQGKELKGVKLEEFDAPEELNEQWLKQHKRALLGAISQNGHIHLHERDIPTWERFKTQWNQRKFQLLNDSIWATANLVTFFWLTGAGTLGYAGNIVTVGLLLMDVSLTVWRFYEESTKHNKRMLELKTKREELEAQIRERNFTINELQSSIESLQEDSIGNTLAILDLQLRISKNQREIDNLQEQVTEIARIERKTAFDWKYKKAGLILDLSYAVGLVLAFSLMCTFFFPPAMVAPGILLILGVAGAALSFALTVAYAAATGGLEIAKTRATTAEIKREYKELLQAFKDTQDELGKLEKDDAKRPELKNLLKQQFIMLKDLEAEAGYHKQMARFQAAKLVRSVFIDAMIPAVVFASLVFMPLGIGLAVIGAGFALAVLSSIILNRFTPKEAEKYKMKEDEEDFKQFKANPDGATAGFLGRKRSGFFKDHSEQTEPTDVDSLIPRLEEQDEIVPLLKQSEI